MTRLAELVRRLSNRRVVVIGDIMLDHFLIGHVDRISPEAPVPVVRFDRDDYRLGGAANVAHNIAAMGGRTELIGIVGDDPAGAEVRRELHASRVGDSGLVVDSRPTTRKVRVVTSRNQQVARLDYEHDGDASGATLASLCDQVSRAAEHAHVMVLSDYRKGVVVPGLIEHTIAAASKSRVPVLVDPKVPQSERYRGVTLITPNHHETELMTGTLIRTPDDARRAAHTLHERTGASVLITWGEHGMWLLDTSGASPIEEALPATAHEVADVTGAGDTVIALLALGLSAGATLGDAARLANTAAGLVVARFGPAVVEPHELIAALNSASA
jgi:D-beta-D-heptose 7-phosphate kinase/D-beta-D-heptose 1-phosphate adenosyltransferase